MEHKTSTIKYDDRVAKGFIITTLVWGTLGLTFGLWIATALVVPSINMGQDWLNFGRFRTAHTSALLYGFVLSTTFAVWYYGSQRLLKIPLAAPKLAFFHLITYNLVILSAVFGAIVGATTARRYSEFEWPVALFLVISWISWGMHIFIMIVSRRERTLYVSIWYFVATFLGIGIVYVFNNLEVPTIFVTGMGDWWHSVSLYSGTNSANIHWWFGHNAVGFVLTVPIVGVSYYMIPKRAKQVLFSYRLSLWAFWGLIFLYLWVGPHHLLFSSLPDWIQTLGMLFSLLLILPSWGSMINLLLTASGKWELLRTDPVFKFLIIGSTFYGLSTLEGPIQAIRSVNALSHYTDWMVGHVHSGALGWVGFTLIGAIYVIVPEIWKRPLYSNKIAEQQFWIQTLGIVLYAVSMWIAGITQGLMWRTTDVYGGLVYSFLDTVLVLQPYYIIRAVGGSFYLYGFCMLGYNIYKTISPARYKKEQTSAATVV
ncbi:MAG: cbb3-type cytochrome c oxidase subunit I [SAR324 cluster bacterium]|nr:cbb3-type cytochrome c oxidase subunit I [SAR324 cluster bacterium]